MPTAPTRLPIKPKHKAPPRGTTTERGYGTAHQKLRARRLVDSPICERCQEDWAAHLHHIDRNPFNRSPGNVVMLCERCHQLEHAR